MMFEHRALRHERKRPRVLRFALLAAVLIAVGSWLWYHSALGAVDVASQDRVSVSIPTGAGLSTIANDLEEKGVIRSSFAFKTHVWLNDQDHLLRAGPYVLQPSMDVARIVEILTGGETAEVSVTIPEGFTVEDIDRLMTKKGFTETGAIVACSKTCAFADVDFLPASSTGPGGRAEGYLYPDTYFVGGEGSDPEAFLGRLLATFRTKVVDGLSAEISASGKSLEDIVIMASLIEEEAANNDERPVISGILWKRLNEGITLGVDASIRYAVNKRTAPLTQSDLSTDSPYNIRVRQGLPPGPITNAGLASIRAALEPETSPYYYYLHGFDGQIRYAATNDEHNANKARYLR